MEWIKPSLNVYDIKELTKQIIANSNSIPTNCALPPCDIGECGSCDVGECGCAAACTGLAGFSCKDFFLIIG